MSYMLFPSTTPMVIKSSLDHSVSPPPILPPTAILYTSYIYISCCVIYTDKTCKLWSAETGQLYHTYRGHATEIVCLSFNPHGSMIATGSMDNTARLWDVEAGECLHTLLGHTAEIVSLDFDTQGQRIITGSFDNTVKVWDVRNGRCVHTLSGHQGEISSCQFNYASDLCISGSIDRTCKVGGRAVCSVCRADSPPPLLPPTCSSACRAYM